MKKLKSKVFYYLVDPALKFLAFGFLGNLLANFSNRFLDIKNGFSYDPKVNGEEKLISLCLQTLFEDALIFDVGANEGNWTNLAIKSGRGDIQIHLFEPTPHLIITLRKKFGNRNNIVLNELALTDSIGELNFNTSGENELNSLITNPDRRNELKQIPVRTTSGFQYYQDKFLERNIDFLKIDVEGNEGKVIEGFMPLLKLKRINVVQFEYGRLNPFAGYLMHDFWALFENIGYKVGRLSITGVDFSDFKLDFNNFKSGPNFVAALPEHALKLKLF